MRQELIEQLCSVARQDERVLLLTADLGYGVLEKFASEFPDRFFNVGVAEQSLIGTATGLAEAGLIPYCYSIATFASLRALEFIRNGPVAHKLPVRIIGVGPGMDYGFDGLSHFAVDDIGSLRSQPGLTIWTPSDVTDIASKISSIHQTDGPVYLRVRRSSNPCSVTRLSCSSPKGSRVSILSLGDAHNIGEHLVAELKAIGFDVSHQVVTLLDQDLSRIVTRHLAETELCITVENHYVVGGLGSIVSEVVAQNGLSVRVIAVGVNSLPIGKLGSPEYLIERFMTNQADVVHKVKSWMKS